jgi:hypothetical protein
MGRGVLFIELIPGTAWGSNVRSRVYRPVWDRLRRAAYAAAGNVCELCGGVGRRHRLECHEVWEYDESRRVQRLVRLIALCPACHAVKHYGRMMNKRQAEEAAAHLMAVNGWDRETTRAHIREAISTWQRRSKGPWTVDLFALELPPEAFRPVEKKTWTLSEGSPPIPPDRQVARSAGP